MLNQCVYVPIATLVLRRMDEIEANKAANERWLARKVPTLEDLREIRKKRVKKTKNFEFYSYCREDNVSNRFRAVRG